MTEDKPFHLTREEINSPLWKKIQQHFEQRLQVSREENDHMHDDKTTARIRGRIITYKEIIGLAEE